MGEEKLSWSGVAVIDCHDNLNVIKTGSISEKDIRICESFTLVKNIIFPKIFFPYVTLCDKQELKSLKKYV